MDAYTQQDYEAIEAAVLESPRGRWFLSEFTRRNRGADTLMLLKAIRKLERGMVEHSQHQVSDELAAGLQSLSGSIGSTLAGIRQSEDVWGAVIDMPEESADQVLIGRMRNAITQLAEVKRQIDWLLAERSSGGAAEADRALKAENRKFFEGDEALFEASPDAATAPSPAFVVVGEEQKTAGPARQQAAQGEPAAPPPAPGPKGDPRDRIVFIRRASSQETSIPLADEADETLPSGQSQHGS